MMKYMPLSVIIYVWNYCNQKFDSCSVIYISFYITFLVTKIYPIFPIIMMNFIIPPVSLSSILICNINLFTFIRPSLNQKRWIFNNSSCPPSNNIYVIPNVYIFSSSFLLHINIHRILLSFHRCLIVFISPLCLYYKCLFNSHPLLKLSYSTITIF